MEPCNGTLDNGIKSRFQKAGQAPGKLRIKVLQHKKKIRITPYQTENLECCYALNASL